MSAPRSRQRPEGPESTRLAPGLRLRAACRTLHALAATAAVAAALAFAAAPGTACGADAPTGGGPEAMTTPVADTAVAPSNAVGPAPRHPAAVDEDEPVATEAAPRPFFWNRMNAQALNYGAILLIGLLLALLHKLAFHGSGRPKLPAAPPQSPHAAPPGAAPAAPGAPVPIFRMLVRAPDATAPNAEAASAPAPAPAPLGPPPTTTMLALPARPRTSVPPPAPAAAAPVVTPLQPPAPVEPAVAPPPAVELPKAALSGSISSFNLGTLLQLLAGEKASGLLRVEDPNGELLGVVVFKDGQAMTASCPKGTGIDAMVEMVRQHKGLFQFETDAIPSFEPTIDRDMVSLLLETFRRIDELGQKRP